MQCKPKVIIDTDAGVDDAMALSMALEAHRRNLIELMAITTVKGNTTVDQANINVFRILETAQMFEIPVYPGASKGLASTFTFPGNPCYGNDGFNDVMKVIPPSLSLLQKEPAAPALIRLVDESPGEIIMIAIGPLTNLAIAINIDPNWTSKLRDFYIMGGNVSGRGNITMMAEFNFVCDPEAAKVVLERTERPIKLTPWETCCQSICISLEERHQLGVTNTATTNLLNLIESTPREAGRWASFDQFCVSWFLHEYVKLILGDDLGSDELVLKSDTFYATVELSGEYSRGQMVIDHSKRLKISPNIVCMREVNKGLYIKYLKLAFH